jgi:hypothetical protein
MTELVLLSGVSPVFTLSAPSGTDGWRTETRLGLAALITDKRVAVPERTGKPENRLDAAFDLSLRVRETQTVSNETSQTRGAEESAPEVTAKKSANFAAHEVHASVAHKESASTPQAGFALHRPLTVASSQRKIFIAPNLYASTTLLPILENHNCPWVDWGR